MEATKSIHLTVLYNVSLDFFFLMMTLKVIIMMLLDGQMALDFVFLMMRIEGHY